MSKTRKDSKGRVLKKGEREKREGLYEYRYTYEGSRCSVYGTSLDELRALEREIIRKSALGQKCMNSSLTINDLFNKWKQLCPGIRDNTFENYCYLYSLYAEKELGKRKIHDIKKSDIRIFYTKLHEQKGISIGTINQLHHLLHQVLEIAVDDEMIVLNPSEGALRSLKKKCSETHSKEALTPEQQKTLELYLMNSKIYYHWYPIISTMLWTGLRIGELSALQWSDIDFESGVITVDKTLIYFCERKQKIGHKCELRIHDTKTDSGNRIITLLPQARAALNEQRRLMEEYDIHCKESISGYSDFVFLNRFGKPLMASNMNRNIARVINSINDCIIDEALKTGKEIKQEMLLPICTNHIFRHTFATRLCENKVNPKVIQDTLGHKTVEMTLNVYAKVSKEVRNEELLKFADKFNYF